MCSQGRDAGLCLQETREGRETQLKPAWVDSTNKRTKDGTQGILGFLNCQENDGDHGYFKLKSMWQNCSTGSLHAVPRMSYTQSDQVPPQVRTEHQGNGELATCPLSDCDSKSPCPLCSLSQGRRSLAVTTERGGPNADAERALCVHA